jgi:hypothetical protein
MEALEVVDSATEGQRRRKGVTSREASERDVCYPSNNDTHIDKCRRQLRAMKGHPTFDHLVGAN